MADEADKILSILVKIGKVDEADLPALKKQIADLGDATGGLEKKTETMEGTHREWHRLIQELGGRSVPGLSEALVALGSGPLGAVIAVSAAFEIWKGRIESVEQMLGTVEMPDLEAGIETAKNMAVAWGGLAQATREAADEYNGLSKLTAAQIKKLPKLQSASSEEESK